MKRKNFLRSLGIFSASSLIPPSGKGLAHRVSQGTDCVLIPSETAGPFPIDLSSNPGMFRTDITEGLPGLPLNLTLTVVNVNDNCTPVVNARVDVWHTNKDGYYSGFVNMGYLGTVDNTGATFCRGIQMTDADGNVQFATIYPGWYAGRVTHIHFQVFISSVLQATSQLAFPDAIDTIVNNSALYVAHGPNPTTNEGDGIFNVPPGDLDYELATVTENPGTGGYNAELIVGIAAPATGIINLEPETGGQFILRQNNPNPFRTECVIPFHLYNSAQVRIDLFDMQAHCLARIFGAPLGAGDHEAVFDATRRKLPAGNYVYQVSVTNAAGTFRQCKVMTIR